MRRKVKEDVKEENIGHRGGEGVGGVITHI
jgi:hypothetical protein